jgi:hypothetical protein
MSGEIRTIRSLWVTRKSIDAGFHPPELVAAWDEWSIDENPQGWADACKHALDSMGSDLAAHRYIDLFVSGDDLDATFDPASLMAVARGSHD